MIAAIVRSTEVVRLTLHAAVQRQGEGGRAAGKGSGRETRTGQLRVVSASVAGRCSTAKAALALRIPVSWHESEWGCGAAPGNRLLGWQPGDVDGGRSPEMSPESSRCSVQRTLGLDHRLGGILWSTMCGVQQAALRRALGRCSAALGSQQAWSRRRCGVGRTRRSGPTSSSCR